MITKLLEVFLLVVLVLVIGYCVYAILLGLSLLEMGFCCQHWVIHDLSVSGASAIFVAEVSSS